MKTGKKFLFFLCVSFLFMGEAHAARVISLAPSITEMVYALGQGTQLVGRTQYSNSPEEAMALPVIGTYNKPDLERILALNPDLCLAIRDGTPPYIIDRLKKMDIAVLVLNPDSMKNMLRDISTLGQALNCQTQADRLRKQAEQRLKNADSRVQELKKKYAVCTTNSPQAMCIPPLKVLFQLQENPIIAAGENSFADQLLRYAGVLNCTYPSENSFRKFSADDSSDVVADDTSDVVANDSSDVVNEAEKYLSSYPRFGMEEIIRMAPDIILIAGMDSTQRSELALSAWSRWKNIPAVRNNHVFVMDSDLFTRPSLRALDALDQLIDLTESVYSSRNSAQ